MKYSEIKDLQHPELKKRLVQTKQALFSARMKHKMQRLSNTMDLRNFRKDIARLETAWATLPKSAFVSDKKPVKSSALLEKTPAKASLTKTSLKKKDKKKDKISKKARKETALAGDLKTKDDDNKLDQKKEDEKKTSTKQKEVLKSAQDKKADKVLPKTKKWFNFFGSKEKTSSDQKSIGRRSFFRRKSG